jgi:methylglyoxal synthase
MEKLVRKIGLVAHDAMKKDLIEWVLWNSELLMGHKFYCTGTTGTLILEALREKHPDVEWDFTILKSGPLGGDQQMGSRIVDGEIDYLFFFTDPMTLQPHDTDVKALTRLAGVENIVFCCNRSTADHIISSPLFVDPTYERTVPDYSNYTKRFANKPVVAEAVESARSGNGKNKDETRFYWAFLIYRYPSFMDSPHWCDSPPLPFEVIELHNNGVGESAHSMSLRYW